MNSNDVDGLLRVILWVFRFFWGVLYLLDLILIFILFVWLSRLFLLNIGLLILIWVLGFLILFLLWYEVLVLVVWLFNRGVFFGVV